MANHNRKTRKTKVETVRVRFTSAADAKAVEERLNTKAGAEVERRGRTITVPETAFRALSRAADSEGVSGTEVGSRGRPKSGEEAPTLRTVGPTKSSAKKKPSEKVGGKKQAGKKTPRDLIQGLPEEARIGIKKRKFVVLCPSTADAKKLVKAIGGVGVQGARATIMDFDEASARKAVKKAAAALEFPVIYEDGFTNKKKPVIDSGTARRPGSKKVAKPPLKKVGKSKPVVSMNVVSSTIAKVWYNMVTLNFTVEFQNGSKYRYADVSLKEFKAFVCADSQGKYFTAHIKDVKETTKLGTK